jgi:hypothetical protein
MNTDNDSIEEAILKGGSDLNKNFVTSSLNPDGLFVMSTSTDGNISPKSDGNPAASPPIISVTKTTTSPRPSGRSRRSNSDIPSAVFSNNTDGASSPQQWVAPPPPPGMYRQQHPHEMISSSWNGSYGLSPYHYAMMGNMQFNNQAGHPPFHAHPHAQGSAVTHSQFPLTYPNDDQQVPNGARNDQYHQNSVNNIGQPYNYPYPLQHHNSMGNSNVFQVSPPVQQAHWQASQLPISMQSHMGQATTTIRPSSLKPPFSQRPPSANENPRQEKRGHRKSLSSSAAAIPMDYGSSWDTGQNSPVELYSSSSQQAQPFPNALHKNNPRISTLPQKSNSSRVMQTGSW